MQLLSAMMRLLSSSWPVFLEEKRRLTFRSSEERPAGGLDDPSPDAMLAKALASATAIPAASSCLPEASSAFPAAPVEASMTGV
jgi:hypothetical protein